MLASEVLMNAAGPVCRRSHPTRPHCIVQFRRSRALSQPRKRTLKARTARLAWGRGTAAQCVASDVHVFGQLNDLTPIEERRRSGGEVVLRAFATRKNKIMTVLSEGSGSAPSRSFQSENEVWKRGALEGYILFRI